MDNNIPITAETHPTAFAIASLAAVYMADTPWSELNSSQKKNLLRITQATLDFMKIPIVHTPDELQELTEGTVLIELLNGSEFRMREGMIDDGAFSDLEVDSRAGRNYLPAMVKSTAPPTVNTVEELNDLPEKTPMVNRHGMVCTNIGGRMYVAGGNPQGTPFEEVVSNKFGTSSGPFTILPTQVQHVGEV